MRLLFDVTRLLESGLHTGIQRVVRCLLRAAQLAPDAVQASVAPVRFEGERWYLLPGLAPHPLEGIATDRQAPGIEFQPGQGDHLLLFDASWYLEPWKAIDCALKRGASVHAMVHDLLPLEQPDWFRPGLQQRFARHLDALLDRATVLYAPSVYVQQRLAEKVACKGSGVMLELLPHGGDFFGGQPLPEPYGLPAALAMQAGPVFLVAGTLEPRKRHDLILDAFDELWQHDHPARLLFVGSSGWEVESLMGRINRHPRLHDRLFHLTGIDDAMLNWLYRHADGLIYLSKGEGFGLPVLEASMLGCPVIATDLPVLHEAGGSWPRYIPPHRDALISALLRAEPRKPAATGRTWAETLARLVATLETAYV